MQLRCIDVAGEVRHPHAHGHQPGCVGAPLDLHAKAERVCARGRRGRGGEGERVGLAALGAERDVDLGRLDLHPGGDLELEPAGQGLLGVVARHYIELDLSFGSGLVGLERRR